MAHIKSNSNKANANDVSVANGELKVTAFHDFLGNNKSQAPDTSDLATERNAGDQLEGIPFYGSRGDITVTDSSNKLIGKKRSTSDSFMGSSRDKILQGQQDPQDSRLLSKLLQYSGVDRQQTSSHFSTDAGNEANASQQGRGIPHVNLGSAWKYPALSGQLSPFGYQASNRFKDLKDTNVGLPIMSQKAADEGSRTGIKGIEVLDSMEAFSVRQPSGVLMRNAKISQPGSESTSGQMTIFYGGQAHVFDSVHQSKADVIMALAGSNGGSWSTSCNPDSAATPSTVEHRIPSGKNDAMLSRWKLRQISRGRTGMKHEGGEM